MVAVYTDWKREHRRRPFNAEAWNHLIRWLSGEVAAPILLVDETGAALFSSNAGTATVDLGGVFAVSSTFGARLDNAVWLLARNAADSANVNLLRLNGSNVVEFGAAGSSLSILASLSNNVALLGRNAAGTGDVTILKVTTADLIELGVAGTRLSVLSPLTNNTPLYGRNAANSASVLLLNLNGSDIIELGASGTRLSPLSPITNNTALGFRNAANSATVSGLLLNASDYFEFGAGGTRVTFSSPLTNNTKLTGRNAANSASVNLIGLNSSDQVDVGVSGTQTNLLGTVVAPLIDPPTVDGQVTNESVCKAFYSGYVSGSSINDGAKYNFTSATYNAAGDYSIAWNRDFSNQFYTALVTVEHGSARTAQINYSKAAGGLDVHVYNPATGLKADCDAFHVVAFGPLS